MMQFSKRPESDKEKYAEKAAPKVAQLKALKNPDGSPDLAKVNAFIKESRNEIWGDVKHAFMVAQNQKCGYCEVMITESTGDVEHDRPKNAVWSLKEPGNELEDLVNIRGRKFNKDFDSGYWWLAYSWDNYLVSCPTCNQKWKNALFPISEDRTEAPVEGDDRSETPLLIDPFGPEPPGEHLAFDEFGQVETRNDSVLGHETIVTCGLDRESLRKSRVEKAVRAFRLLKRLFEADTDEDVTAQLRDFHELGRPEYVHSGMVRTIFEHQTGMIWQELENSFGNPSA